MAGRDSCDYYGGSAPSLAGRQTVCPARAATLAAWVTGRTRDGSRVHLLIARRRRHPTRPLRHRRGYPAARHRGLPSVPPTCRGVPRLRYEGDRVRVASGPDPPGSSRCVFERRRTSVSRVCLSVTLATPASSGSTDTSWLCQGRLPPIPAPPETGCPQLHRPAATGRRRRSLTSTQSTSASRRTGGMTHLPSAGDGEPLFTSPSTAPHTEGNAELPAVDRYCRRCRSTRRRSDAAGVRGSMLQIMLCGAHDVGEISSALSTRACVAASTRSWRATGTRCSAPGATNGCISS
jgi:hypothetical protein